MMHLRYHNFSLVTGNRTIIEPLSLELQGPGVIALLGPSGVGKTSLLRATQNLVLRKRDNWSHTGDILLDGKSVFLTRNIAQKIGFIHQKPRMLAGSIRDNVTFALKYTTRLSKAAIHQKAEEVLHQVGLSEEVPSLDTPAWCLSGGQAQRLAIARSIAMDPAVLLMDEPCSALDPVTSGKMERLIQNMGRTHLVVLVTHNTRLAERIADQVAFIMPGPTGAHLMAHGPTEEVFKRPPNPRVCEFIQFDSPGSCPAVNPSRRARLKQLFLFICEGNTSRSPMAQAICNQEVAQALEQMDRDFAQLEIEAMSAGIETQADRPFSPQAHEALVALGYQPHEHRTRNISGEIAQRATAIYCMTRDQCRTLIQRFPEYAHKVHPLDRLDDIANPQGGDQKLYGEIAQRIRDAVRWRLRQLHPIEAFAPVWESVP